MARSSLLVAGLLLASCGGARTAPPAAPTPATAPTPAPAPTPAAAPAPAAVPPVAAVMLSDHPSPGAPAELAQFGRFVGAWHCRTSNLGKDGAWTALPGMATWTWFYTLDGHAILDVWQPPAGAHGSIGVNLRIYDPPSHQWKAVWTTAKQTLFDHFTATADQSHIVMTGDRPARAAFPAHRARITFHDITPSSYDWLYESKRPGSAGGAWRKVSRIHCDRVPQG